LDSTDATILQFWQVNQQSLSVPRKVPLLAYEMDRGMYMPVQPEVYHFRAPVWADVPAVPPQSSTYAQSARVLRALRSRRQCHMRCNRLARSGLLGNQPSPGSMSQLKRISQLSALGPKSSPINNHVMRLRGVQ